MPTPSIDARLLRALRGRPLPCGELAGMLGVMPDVVRSRVGILRAAGYEIEEQPHLGYRLVAAPDRLIADDILSRLDRASLVNEIVVFEETGSTNDVVAQLGRGGAREGLVVFAEKQKSGRGRLGRRWEASAGRGLWFSLLLRPAFPLRSWARLTTWAAVAVAQGIEDAASCRASIKWPNDIYLGGLKMAGILIETQVDGSGSHFAVAGIGVNVNQEENDFPEALRGKAGSLRLAGGHLLDRQGVAAAILQRLDSAYSRIGPAFPEMVAVAREKSCLVGSWVEISGGATREEGTVEGLDEEGALLLRQAGGKLVAIRAGEVSVTGWRGKEGGMSTVPA